MRILLVILIVGLAIFAYMEWTRANGAEIALLGTATPVTPPVMASLFEPERVAIRGNWAPVRRNPWEIDLGVDPGARLLT